MFKIIYNRFLKLGSFLIPYLTLSLLIGFPFALLEVSLGQWMKEGGIGAWEIVPVFKGEILFKNIML